MKKSLLLLPILALTACDKPTSNATLTCKFDSNWKIANVLYVGDIPKNSDGMWDIEVKTKITTYENYAKITVDNITTTFEKVREEKQFGEFGYVDITYRGNFPGSEREALLNVYGDITNKQISEYAITFIGEKFVRENGKEVGLTHHCFPVLEIDQHEFGLNTVPFNHHYKMPNKIEKCITDICEKVFCENDACNLLSIDTHVKTTVLSAQDAISLSKNWDYNDMKYYRNDGKLEEHEKDACEVLDRINKFIYDNDLDSHEVKSVQQAMDDCKDDCRTVLATGEIGDYLLRVPETDELRQIANKQKNAKFLSIFNPNSYAKPGYCLINVIPYNAMQKLGTPNNNCHYRIYCGAPEYMNYDEPYAVEVCN